MRTTRTSGKRSATSSAVPSVDALSTTTTSEAFRVWRLEALEGVGEQIAGVHRRDDDAGLHYGSTIRERRRPRDRGHPADAGGRGTSDPRRHAARERLPRRRPAGGRDLGPPAPLPERRGRGPLRRRRRAARHRLERHGRGPHGRRRARARDPQAREGARGAARHARDAPRRAHRGRRARRRRSSRSRPATTTSWSWGRCSAGSAWCS